MYNMDYQYGFTCKATSQDPGMYLRIPKLTVQSAQIKDGDLLQLKVTNQKGNSVKCSREAQKNSGQVKIYLPKQQSNELELQHKDLVDVFFRKK